MSNLIAVPWVAEVRSWTGIEEAPGGADNPIIMFWRENIARAFPEMREYVRGYVHDAVPWCGLFMAGCMARVGVRPPFGERDTDRFLWALSWADWGTRLSHPIPGCVVVFHREGGGHVAMCEYVRDETIWIRGGNQRDAVNVMSRDREDLVAAVWPPGLMIAQVQGSTAT